MHCIAKQHYGVVVNREPSFLFYSGGPPHQQSVLQPYEQPATTNQQFSVSFWFAECVCAWSCVSLCVFVCYNLKGKAL